MNKARFSALHLSHLAEQAERFMLMSYERLPRSLVLHNDAWANALAGHALEIALRRPGVSPDLPHLARSVAFLQACRYWSDDGELREWEGVIREFRDWTGPDYAQLQMSLAAVLPGGSSNLRREVADVLYDALLSQRILSGAEGAELTWLENRYASGASDPGDRTTRLVALSRYLDELRQARFRDGELRRGYQHTHSAVLLDLQKVVDRLERKYGTSAIDKATNQSPEVSQEGLRMVLDRQRQLNQTADRKAAIVMLVCLASIAGAVAVGLTAAAGRPEIQLSLGVYGLGCLLSLLCTVVATRPARPDYSSDPARMYEQLGAELREVGQINVRTYRQLRIAYGLLLGGLVAAMVTAAVMWGVG